MTVGKAKMFRDRKEVDGIHHRGKGGRKARQARTHKRAIERTLRQAGRKECREY